MQIHIKVTFEISPFNKDFADIIIAELSEYEYDNFVETDKGIEAYIKKDSFNIEIIESNPFINDNPSISYKIEELVEENWNQTWEENYPYIELENCIIVAPFHENFPRKKYEILIAPKMSFGTGHHSTTHMMLDYIMNSNMENKQILDMGCGTGVLAILASKKGAKKLTAIDIDNWAYENTQENISLNKVQNIKVFKGDKTLLGNESFDIIFANINRNILLQDIPTYSKILQKKGRLFLSGFYTNDIEAIAKKCIENNLQLEEKKERNNWSALSFSKV
jgi:ribosomal protein L11 methyltransferase